MADESEINAEEREPAQGMAGRRKAAALLVALGTDACARIFKILSADEVELLAAEIAELQYVDQDTMLSIIREFREMMSTEAGVVRGGIAYATEALSKAFGANSAVGTAERIRLNTDVKPLDHLVTEHDSIESLQEMMQDENPQTIALILANMKEQRAAETLLSLPPDLQAEVTARIADMTTASPDIIAQIEATLKRKCRGHQRVRTAGLRITAEILNSVEIDVEKRIMESIADKDPELATKISDLMFTYDNIIAITDVGMQKLLQAINEIDLLMALKASTEEMKAKFFANMSERRRQTIQADFESMPLVRLKEVRAAQQRILAVAKEMILSGGIVITRHAEQEVYV